MEHRAGLVVAVKIVQDAHEEEDHEEGIARCVQPGMWVLDCAILSMAQASRSALVPAGFPRAAGGPPFFADIASPQRQGPAGQQGQVRTDTGYQYPVSPF
jgi:hypothetical protein